MRHFYILRQPETDPADGGAVSAPAEDLTTVPDGEAAPNEPDDLLAGFDEALAKADAKPEPAEPEPDAPAEPEAKTPAEPAAEADPVDTEIAALGLKEKSATRFRELAAEVKELAPIREQLKAAGIEKIEDLPRIAQRARDADELITMVSETGASPEQYGMALDYLRLVNTGMQGDIKAAEQAYAVMSKELSALAQLLGKEVPGVHDPLAAHPDLTETLAMGDITRKYALEVAQSRTHQTVRSRADEQVQAQTAQERAIEEGRQRLNAFDQQAAAADPSYAAKRPILHGIVQTIRETLPPQQWLAATQRAYAAIQLPAAPAPAVPAPAPRPSPGPVRANGPRPSMTPTFDDPMQALEYGVANPPR